MKRIILAIILSSIQIAGCSENHENQADNNKLETVKQDGANEALAEIYTLIEEASIKDAMDDGTLTEEMFNTSADKLAKAKDKIAEFESKYNGNELAQSQRYLAMKVELDIIEGHINTINELKERKPVKYEGAQFGGF